MNTSGTTESPCDALARLFVGRSDVFGTYDPATGRVWQVKHVVSLADYEQHLRGVSPLGIYPLVGSRVRFAAVDFDTPDTELVLRFARLMGQRGWFPHVELSKSKGYHCWFFFTEPADAATVRQVLGKALTDVGAPAIEVFPKQDRLSLGEYGNFINLPLFGQAVAQGRTVFVDSAFSPLSDQWAYLRGAKLTPAPIARETESGGPRVPSLSSSPSISSWGLPPCVQRMLREGVTGYQRVSCFRLAVALRKAGLPADAAQAVLITWAAKNRPAYGKRTITPNEIGGQIRSAYQGRAYRSYGCEDPAVSPFCVEGCPVKPKVVQ